MLVWTIMMAWGLNISFLSSFPLLNTKNCTIAYPMRWLDLAGWSWGWVRWKTWSFLSHLQIWWGYWTSCDQDWPSLQEFMTELWWESTCHHLWVPQLCPHVVENLSIFSWIWYRSCLLGYVRDVLLYLFRLTYLTIQKQFKSWY